MKPLLKFCWLWIFPYIKLPWHSCSMWDKPGWLNWSWQFLCEELSSLNLKRFYYAHAWSRSLCEGRTSFCTGLISRKLLQILRFLYQSPSSSLCTVFDSISSNIVEILTINVSANVLVFGDFNINHKDWLTYSGGTDRPGELCYNFSISNDLTQKVNFRTQIPDCDSHSPALLDLFLSTDTSI